jgi:hypothetical protein
MFVSSLIFYEIIKLNYELIIKKKTISVLKKKPNPKPKPKKT